MNVYAVRADFGKYTEVFRDHSFVGIGWLKGEDILENISKDVLFQRMQVESPEKTKMGISQNVGQVLRFLNDIKEGDIVITPFSYNDLLVGKVVGPNYREDDNLCPFDKRKKVEWFDKTLDRSELSIPLQNTLRSSLTVFKVRSANEILEYYDLIDKQVKKELELTKNNVYESIRKKFLELDATEFEQLVSYVLRALGFEATQSTGKVGDGGIDYEGVLNVMGLATIKLQIQVKRYERNSIGERDIRNLRGALKRDYQGAFITLSKFAKKAKESASDPEKVPINLINGIRFTEIFIEEYDKIMDAIYEEDNDDLAEKLKFKKALIVE